MVPQNGLKLTLNAKIYDYQCTQLHVQEEEEKKVNHLGSDLLN